MNIFEILKLKIYKIYEQYLGEDKNFPIFYIAGSQTLPPPLSRRRRRGDVKKTF